MLSLSEYIKEKTRIDAVSRPGYWHHTGPFTIMNREPRSDSLPEGPLVYFYSDELLRGEIATKVVQLLDDCFVTGQDDYNRYKSNPSGAYIPYRGHAGAMYFLFQLIAFLFVALVVLVIGGANLGLNWWQAIIAGAASLLLLLWMVGVYFRIGFSREDRLAAQAFVQMIEEDKLLKDNKPDVISVLEKVTVLHSKKDHPENPRIFIAGAKRVLRLMKKK